MHVYCGSTDSNVSENGKELLLEIVKEDIYPKIVDAFYTSKLIRTIETIAILYPGVEYKSLEEFNEVNFGEYEMQPHEELMKRPEYVKWQEGDKFIHFDCPGGDNFEGVSKRINKGMEKIFTDAKNNGYKNIVIIGGGVGIPPLYFFAKRLAISAKRVNVILGGRNTEALCLKEDISEFANIYLSTDDGSDGFKGNVIDLFKELIISRKIQKPIVYACGPQPMLKALKCYMIENEIEGYFSLEAMMGCGFGMCLACAIEKNSSGNKKQYALCCIDGPVFNFNEMKL